MSSFIIGTNSSSLLKLNESLSNKEQYILEGIFAQFDTENRNGRIYTKDEYLPHLGYLRADIKKGESLLGELDHPEDRFEVSLQNASHQVLDIWLDESKNCVMGKIKLLDTPSGKIAKALVDDGIPLHISSRAAGTVDSRTKQVSIQQIFTYDIVAKPGFSAAVLHRVNESVDSTKFSEDTMSFLRESLTFENNNIALQYGLNENVSMREVLGKVNIRPEAQNIDINNKINVEEMTHSVNESNVDSPLKPSENAAASMGIEQPDMTLEATENEETPQEETANEPENTDNIDDNKDDNKESLILGVKAEFGEESEESLILEIKPLFDEEETTEEETEEEEKTEDSSEDDAEEQNESEDKKEVEATEYNKLNDDTSEKDKVTENKTQVLGKVDDLLNNLKKKKELKESQFAKYPFSKYLNENEYAKFDNLDWKQKEKVNNYIIENCITEKDSINRLWEGALMDKSVEEPIWLKNASAEYRNLYENATKAEQDNLAMCASYLIFESQYDVDMFWQNSNLKKNSELRKLNESFNKIAPGNGDSINGLPYGQDFVNEITKQTLAITER